MRTISIIHPSRGRPQQAFKTYNKWVDSADTHIEYILSLDLDDISPYFEYFIVTEIVTNPNKSAIEAINNAAKVATGDIIIVISDDTDCFPGWDTALLKEIPEYLTDFLVKTQDGIQPIIITMPIMDREYYNRFGYIYHPDYTHMFCDTEMTTIGHMLGRVITSTLSFPHNHYSTGATQADALNERNDATWKQGEGIFIERLQTNFGIENPLTTFEKIFDSKIKLSVLICTMPDRAGCLLRLGGVLVPQLNDNVEVIVDCSMAYNIGTKRQKILELAKGEYIVYVDDDDLVSNDYISKILKACEIGADCIGISGTMTTNGTNEKQWHISKEYGAWAEHNYVYYRTPNHISPVRRELALQVGFNDMKTGEDYDYSMRLLPLLNTEIIVEGNIYLYEYIKK